MGVATVQTGTKFEVINDLISIMDMNSVVDFDLVREKTLTIDSEIISDELVFDIDLQKAEQSAYITPKEIANVRVTFRVFSS